MKTPWKDRLAYWLETTWLRRLVLTPHGVNYRGAPMWRNRINGHVIVEVHRA